MRAESETGSGPTARSGQTTRILQATQAPGQLSRSVSLPSDVLAESAKRLGTAALLLTATTYAFWVAHNVVLVRERGSLYGTRLDYFVLPTLGLLAAAIYWASRSSRLRPRVMMNVGLVYQVCVALALGLMVNHARWPAEAAPAFSPIAVLILLFAMLVPAPPIRVLLAGLASAVMDPLSLMILVMAGDPMPEVTLILQRFIPDILAVALAVAAVRVLHQLGEKITDARLMGSYYLERKLGKGGMGEVWVARHRLLAREAAIKLVNPESLQVEGEELPHVLERFEREAQAIAELESLHSIEIYDFGITEQGTLYYAMELLNGLDMETLVGRFGALPPERVVALLLQVCHSLADAHGHGLIHRDVKPANIFVCRKGPDYDFVKVLDFGLVKRFRGGAPEVGASSATFTFRGTPAYVAPETIVGHGDLDARVDIYGLGCVGYWLLSGKRVFESDTPAAVMLDHLEAQPVPPSAKTRTAIPAELENILLECLAKRPEERPQSVAELAERLSRIGLADKWTPARAREWWERAPMSSALKL